jgi:hypothetical protein
VMGLCGAVAALVVLAREKLGTWVHRIPLLMSVCGAPLRLAVITQEKLDRWLWYIPRPATSPAGLEECQGVPARPSVPYGVAIAVAGVLILFFQSSVPG